MASILRHTDKNDGFAENRILYAGPNTSGGRSNGTIWVSFDEGESWPLNKTIYPGGYAYSQLVKLSDHELGVFFERDGYDNITLAKFPHSWIAGGADPLLQTEPYGSPTPGSGGVSPTLHTLGSSEAGGNITLEVQNAAPLVRAFFADSKNRTMATMNGCTLLVEPPFLSVFPLTTDASGTGHLEFSIPPHVTGHSVCVQAGILDPGAPSGSGWSSTDAVQIWFH